jgi:hypothetical protein
MNMKISSVAPAAGVLAIVAIFAASVSAEGMKEPPSKRGSSHEKVYLGQDAPPGAFPFQVALIFSDAKKGEEFNSLHCGGSLISDTFSSLNPQCAPAASRSL